ncbi:MAG TPA: HAD family phosphatase [Terriglobales bacterium]|nr:HAD family phosphatase [Terriglobales bacterium]
MNLNHSLRAVIFDYGRVLSLPPADADWAAFAAATNLPLDTLHYRYWEHRDPYDRKEVSAAEYWERVTGDIIEGDRLAELIALDDAQWTRINPEMLRRARQLSAASLKIAILSNMQVDMLRVMRAKFDWLDEFDVQMYSCEVGLVKPDREVYLECLQRLDVRPKEALFLDDKQKNTAGAEAVGMHTLLFDGDITAFDRKLVDLGVELNLEVG